MRPMARKGSMMMTLKPAENTIHSDQTVAKMKIPCSFYMGVWHVNFNSLFVFLL